MDSVKTTYRNTPQIGSRKTTKADSVTQAYSKMSPHNAFPWTNMYLLHVLNISHCTTEGQTNE